jgi:hypothetical protein
LIVLIVLIKHFILDVHVFSIQSYKRSVIQGVAKQRPGIHEGIREPLDSAEKLHLVPRLAGMTKKNLNVELYDM